MFKFKNTLKKNALFGSILLCSLAACDNGGGSSSTDSSSSSGSSSSSSSSSGLLPIASNLTVRINEASPSNGVFTDEDANTPDWFELYNNSKNPISLEGWTITDDPNNPNLWAFPNFAIAANSYLKIWASGEDRSDTGTHKTYITQGATFRYLVPSQSVDREWTTLSFNDSTWLQGTSGFGYTDDDDSTLLPEGTTSVFMRKKFTATNIDSIKRLILDIDYDDAFVAYINGNEIARNNIDGVFPSYKATAKLDHEALIYAGKLPERFTISNPISFLQEGENIFSVQVHNQSIDSSDLTAIPFLSALYIEPTANGHTPPDILNLSDLNFHTNFKISSKGETLYLYDNTGLLVDSLKVSDIPQGSSIGRSASSDTVTYFDNPTPGTRNSNNEYSGVVHTNILFSDDGGITNTQNLTLSGSEKSQTIRYTLDATIPTQISTAYSAPLEILSNTVVRARIFENGSIPSRTQSHTYIIDKTSTLPVVALVTEPNNFFDVNTGIYSLGLNYEEKQPNFGANFWENKETDIHFSFYEINGDLGIEFDAGVKIFGGWSRANEQRSLSIFARGQYGTKEIDYPLFPKLNYTEFQSFILRNSGNDWMHSMLRDVAMTSLMDGSGLETQSFRTASVYLNGNYWGFYNLREKINTHFLASKYQIKAKDIDLLEINADIVSGDNSEYKALIEFVSNNNLSDDDNYQYVADRVDIENFIIYEVAEIYFDNSDWPGNNIKFWKSPGTKWRWILYDTDFGFNLWKEDAYTHSSLFFALVPDSDAYANPPWSTLLLRSLSENTSFRNQFINRFSDELNSRFLPSNVSLHIDKLSAIIEPEIEKHTERWKDHQVIVDDYDTPLVWSDDIANMKNFGDKRPENMKQQILSSFDLSAIHPLTIENDKITQGYVQLNTLTIREPEWTGDYFEDVPITLTAVPKADFSFSNWTGDITSTNATITLNLTAELTVKPVFIAKSKSHDDLDYQGEPLHDDPSHNLDKH